MVVADSGPLIAFARLSALGVLHEMFGKVLVPRVVADECTFQLHRPGAQAIAAAIEATVLTRMEVGGVARFAETHLLDASEAAALLLAQAQACPALVDERRGRRVAARLGVPVVGTVGVLLAARQAGKMPALNPLLDSLDAFGYRLPKALAGEALLRAGEA
ncbi:MAG: DUF3368 domain-containing protein [Rhodocyclaceae bacterium]|nr:MAG: DUF3368 domain-containing protein [Pseudomonadota bacterium]